MKLPTMAIVESTCIALSPAQARVYVTFASNGALTDFSLGYAYRLTHGTLDQTWSGLRTRRAELVAKGVLEVVDVVRNENGRMVQVWDITEGVDVAS